MISILVFSRSRPRVSKKLLQGVGQSFPNGNRVVRVNRGGGRGTVINCTNADMNHSLFYSPNKGSYSCIVPYTICPNYYGSKKYT